MYQWQTNGRFAAAIHILSPILEKSLSEFHAPENLSEVDFSETKEVIIDATERLVQRPTYNQKALYSGDGLLDLCDITKIGIVIFAKFKKQG